MTNNGTAAQDVSWDLSLDQERVLEKGVFGKLGATDAHFDEAPSGSLSIEAGKSASVTVPVAGMDPLKLYHVRASISDAAGRASATERLIGGLVRVPKAATSPVIDGSLDDAIWASAPVQAVDREDQVRLFKEAAPWKGPADLSAKLRFAWDDAYFYVGAEVTDDLPGDLKMDGAIWQQDSLQFLVAPAHDQAEEAGKYDYTVALGQKGPQVWASMVADTGVPAGEAKDVKVAIKKGAGGSLTYEIAFPWSGLTPFKPRVGADLGLCAVVNEDDGKGRHSLMTWFGDIQTKQVDTVGDLVLAP